jgi:C2H2-type zinc ribbon
MDGPAAYPDAADHLRVPPRKRHRVDPPTAEAPDSCSQRVSIAALTAPVAVVAEAAAAEEEVAAVAEVAEVMALAEVAEVAEKVVAMCVPTAATGNKTHVCPHSGCGRTFTRKPNMMAHQRKHMPIWDAAAFPFGCGHCLRRFKWRSSLKAHVGTCASLILEPARRANEAREKEEAARAAERAAGGGKCGDAHEDDVGGSRVEGRAAPPTASPPKVDEAAEEESPRTAMPEAM